MIERHYRRTKADTDIAAWHAEKLAMHKFFKKKKVDYWCRRVNAGRENSKELWQSLSELTDQLNGTSAQVTIEPHKRLIKSVSF